MSQTRPHPALALGGSLLFLVVALLVAPQITRTNLPSSSMDLFLPRAILGALAGCGLAASGVVLQSVLRNPLASPYTLGLASGASVGAAVVIQLPQILAYQGISLSPALQELSLPATYLGALAGSLLSSLLVYGVATRRSLAAETLLLAGVAVALFSGAVVTVLHYMSSTIDLFQMVRWAMGNLSVTGYKRVWLALPLVLSGLILLLWIVRRLDVASLDDDSARGLGVDPIATRKLAFLGTSLVTAGVVAVAGPIGFVGLIVPHAVRRLVGPDPRLLFPCAALVGGGFLVVCDTLARTLFYPSDLPINVITHAIGCPAFVWILLKRR